LCPIRVICGSQKKNNKQETNELPTLHNPRPLPLRPQVQRDLAIPRPARAVCTRDFVARYKQTVLGPTWFIIQPLMQMLMYTLVFGNIAGIQLMVHLKGYFTWQASLHGIISHSVLPKHLMFLPPMRGFLGRFIFPER
jgi:hypothetical protein